MARTDIIYSWERGTAMPTTEFDGRRLVLAYRSFPRIVSLQPYWWGSDLALQGSSWNVDDFSAMLDATMAPDSVFIADLTQKQGDHWTHMWLSTLNKLGSFDAMLEALHGRIGQLRIHYGYDTGSNTMQSLDYDCAGGNSVVHLITGGVWHDLFQIHFFGDYQARDIKQPGPVTTLGADWANLLMTIGGLPEPVGNCRGIGPLVRSGFECPYDEIVDITGGLGAYRPGLLSTTTYRTLRTGA